MKKAYVFLADGFEEIEAVTPIDTLRRAGVEVVTVGVTGRLVNGAHGIAVQADVDGAGFALPEDAGLVVLPGGWPGFENLANSPMVDAVLAKAGRRGLFIAAICAGPTVLHKAGLLRDKTATVFPSMEGELPEAKTVTGAPVEVDGNIITGRSAGVALDFSHALITALCGAAKADEVIGKLHPEK